MSPPPPPPPPGAAARALALGCLVWLLAGLAPAPATADSIWFPHATRSVSRRGNRPYTVTAEGGVWTREGEASAPGAPAPEIPVPAPPDVTAGPAPGGPVAPAATEAGAVAATDGDVPLVKIPVDFLLKLSDVENSTYFIENFIDNNTLPEKMSEGGSGLGNRFGEAGDERKSVQSAKPALCQPHPELVALSVTTDPSSYYYPTCTRIERCGGCCGSSILACQPQETEIVNVKVIVAKFTGSLQMAFKGHEIIPLERHTKCICECIKKENDCNQLQKYQKNLCECVCMNTDEQQKCISQSESKEWDASTCTCKCRETRFCNSDTYFDNDSCSCTQRSSYRDRRRERYFHEPTL